MRLNKIFVNSHLYNQMEINTSALTKYLIAQDWWNTYSALDSDCNSPGPIDNSKLFQNLTNDMKYAQLKQDLLENTHFVSVPEELWKSLVDYFGGGPEVEVFYQKGIPDLGPVTVEVRILGNFAEFPPETNFCVSLQMTIQQFKTFLCKKLNLPSKKFELEEIKENGRIETLEGKDQLQLGEAGVTEGSSFCLTVENLDNFENANDLQEDQEVQKAIQMSLESSNKTENVDMAQETVRNDKQEWEWKISHAAQKPLTKLKVHKTRRVLELTKLQIEEFKKWRKSEEHLKLHYSQ